LDKRSVAKLGVLEKILDNVSVYSEAATGPASPRFITYQSTAFRIGTTREVEARGVQVICRRIRLIEYKINGHATVYKYREIPNLTIGSR